MLPPSVRYWYCKYFLKINNKPIIVVSIEIFLVFDSARETLYDSSSVPVSVASHFSSSSCRATLLSF